MACFFEGISFGWLLLSAVLIGAQTGNPFGLIGSALVLTALTGVGLTAYVWSGPKEFKMLGAVLSTLSLPMLVLMVVSFAVPSLFGGVLGIGLTALFVVISAAGLLYQINVVLHQLGTEQHIEGSYLITLGILVLYWNILSLLMRLSSSD
ncbi:MAG: Bax inhibitor-1 family protein, partial [Myxococcota bacterium]